MFMSVVKLMFVCFTYSRCKTVNLYVTVVLVRVVVLLARIRFFLRSAGDLPLVVFLVTRTHVLDALSATFLTAVAIKADRSLLTFPMGDVRVFASTPDS